LKTKLSIKMKNPASPREGLQWKSRPRQAQVPVKTEILLKLKDGRDCNVKPDPDAEQ
jgi:hypothetical protein